MHHRRRVLFQEQSGAHPVLAVACSVAEVSGSVFATGFGGTAGEGAGGGTRCSRRYSGTDLDNVCSAARAGGSGGVGGLLLACSVDGVVAGRSGVAVYALVPAVA